MDTSHVSQFLTSLPSVGFFQRLFSWKKILADARIAQDNLNNITSQYSQEVTQFHIKIQRSDEDIRRVNESYQSTLDEKRRIETRLSESETRVSEYLNKIESLQTKQQEISGALQIERADCVRLRDETAGLKKEKAALNEKYDKLFTDYQSVQGEIASCKVQADNAGAVAAELTTLKETHEKLGNDYNAVKQELALSRQSVEREQERVSNLEKQLTTITSEKQQKHDRVIELEGQLKTVSAAASKYEEKYNAVEKELKTAHDELTAAKTLCDSEFAKYTDLKADFDANMEELTKAKNQIAADESIREEQTKEYQRNVTSLRTLFEEQRIAKKELEEQDEQRREERNKTLATAWQRHEGTVESYMHEIANKYDFALCDKNSYPHQGAPDNAFLIGGMYTIFDAKSPKNPEELGNFPIYLKQQAEKMGKYCKNEDVRKDAYLVVPASTLEVLDTYMYPMADYTVYVITPEAVLPILQMLRLIENYDFAEQLSPEERSSICQLIGRLSHTAKRKIQIDTYLSREMIRVLQGIGSLPEGMEADVSKYEKEAKLNPPLEKRVKVIQINSLSDDVEKIYNDTLGWSVGE